jgi:hypothetical protein
MLGRRLWWEPYRRRPRIGRVWLRCLIGSVPSQRNQDQDQEEEEAE